MRLPSLHTRRPLTRSKPYPHPAERDDGGGITAVSANNKLTSIQGAEAFAKAVEDFIPLVTDHKEYRALLLDLAKNGQIDHPERRAKAKRLNESLKEALH